MQTDFSPRLVFHLSKASAVRGVFTARPAGVGA